MKSKVQIQEAIDALNKTLENIVEGTVMEALYTGQVAALEWALRDEEVAK